MWRDVELSINKIDIFPYTIEFSSLWHDSLAYLNYKSAKYMKKLGLISCNREWC